MGVVTTYLENVFRTNTGTNDISDQSSNGADITTHSDEPETKEGGKKLTSGISNNASL